MKPVNLWTQEEKNTFLFHFCDLMGSKQYHTQGFIDFDDVKSFMETKWPEMWEEYLKSIYTAGTSYNYSRDLDRVLDLRNLITFLLEPEQVEKWGWVECPHKVRKYHHKAECPFCNDDGKVKHPAIIFAEGLK